MKKFNSLELFPFTENFFLQYDRWHIFYDIISKNQILLPKRILKHNMKLIWNDSLAYKEINTGKQFSIILGDMYLQYEKQHHPHIQIQLHTYRSKMIAPIKYRDKTTHNSGNAVL